MDVSLRKHYRNLGFSGIEKGEPKISDRSRRIFKEKTSEGKKISWGLYEESYDDTAVEYKFNNKVIKLDRDFVLD